MTMIDVPDSLVVNLCNLENQKKFRGNGIFFFCNWKRKITKKFTIYTFIKKNKLAIGYF